MTSSSASTLTLVIVVLASSIHHSRGQGTIPKTCGAGQCLDGLLCYNCCPAGYKPSGCCTCIQTCPAGYTDGGAFCFVPVDIYGKGCCCTVFGCCGCGANGARGYIDDGCTCRNPGTSFTKKTVTRGPGKSPTCEAGKEIKAGLCFTCASGKISAKPGDSCSDCPAGTIAAASKTSCTLCGPGQSSVAGVPNCFLCPLGTYSVLVSGATPRRVCTSCPAGQTTAATGSTDKSQCIACPRGQYLNELKKCTLCPARSYCSGGTAKPEPCPSGSSSVAGRGECFAYKVLKIIPAKAGVTFWDSRAVPVFSSTQNVDNRGRGAEVTTTLTFTFTNTNSYTISVADTMSGTTGIELSFVEEGSAFGLAKFGAGQKISFSFSLSRATTTTTTNTDASGYAFATAVKVPPKTCVTAQSYLQVAKDVPVDLTFEVEATCIPNCADIKEVLASTGTAYTAKLVKGGKDTGLLSLRGQLKASYGLGSAVTLCDCGFTGLECLKDNVNATATDPVDGP